MRCPFCGNVEDKVVDSREAKDGNSIRRRRECIGCGKRFTSYERIDEIPYMIVKKDGQREKFDRNKILSGLLRASEKRPISAMQLEQVVDKVEKYVQNSSDKERKSSALGKIIMRELKKLDKVAYVRFASVYLEFEDVSEFMTELKYLVQTRRTRKKSKKTGGKKKT
ncbi:MAG: transcriptional repressor NrdR [Pyrinomonadaceae bacterium]|nr:transcriptional repressor NrdR [Pyrinomonadaceae bacterium]